VARTEDHLEGDVIIHKGDMGSTFYVILEGVVLITEASLGDGGGGNGEGDSGDTLAGTGASSPSSTEPVRPSPTKGSQLPKSSSKVQGGIRLKAGEWFGEIALLNDGKRTANVLADSSARLLVFDRVSFEQVGSL
jgi:CRP-like cAMP-binding protein